MLVIWDHGAAAPVFTHSLAVFVFIAVVAMLSLIAGATHVCAALRSGLTATLCRSVVNTTISGSIGEIRPSNQIQSVHFDETHISGTVPEAVLDFSRLDEL